jgi:trk system potassium uptake protein TrkH
MGETGSPHASRRIARYVMIAYLLLTAACCLLALGAGMNLQFAALHSLTAVSTAGFSTYNDSLSEVGRFPATVLILFALLGAIALPNYLSPVLRSGLRLRRAAFVIFALIFAAAILTGCVTLFERMAGSQFALYDMAFAALSAQTTTGYSTLTIGDLSGSSKLVLSIGMIIGGDIGSTAGGMKIMRFTFLIMMILPFWRKKQASPPDQNIRVTIAVCAAYVALPLIGGLLLWIDGHALVDAIFEAASAIGTVGLSSGITGNDPSALTKLVLILGMTLGRVEVLFLIHLLLPSTGRE